MSILTWLKTKFARRSVYTNPPPWFREWITGGGSSASGVTVNERTAWTYAAFYCAIDLIARGVAQLPLVLYKRQGSDRNRATAHPLYELLHTRPNPEQTSFTFRSTMQANVLTWGNAYAEIERNGAGRPKALHGLEPWRVWPYRTDSHALMYEVKGPDNSTTQANLSPDNIIHIRTLGDGVVGKSPVQLFRETIGLGMASEKAGASFFGQGMRPSGVFEHPGKLGDIAYGRLKADLNDRYAGPANTGKAMLLEEGLKWAAQSIPPGDAQYIESRTFGIRDISRIFHVPPHKLADLADATFSNVEEQNIEWVTDCLQPWLVSWEQELAWKCLGPSERADYYPEHLVAGILRGNAVARGDYYNRLFNLGSITINEIRRLENMNGIGKAGDVNFVPLNMTTAELAKDGPPKPPPPPAPAPPPVEPAKPAPPAKPEPAPDEESARSTIGPVLEQAVGRVLRAQAKAALDPAWAAQVLLPACIAYRRLRRRPDTLDMAAIVGSLSEFAAASQDIPIATRLLFTELDHADNQTAH